MGDYFLKNKNKINILPTFWFLPVLTPFVPDLLLLEEIFFFEACMATYQQLSFLTYHQDYQSQRSLFHVFPSRPQQQGLLYQWIKPDKLFLSSMKKV